MVKIEEIYTWLSMLDNLEYITYLKLIKVFDSSKKLYIISKEKDKFEKVLIQNNLNLNENLKSELLNSNLKLKSKKIYEVLKNQNIKIIPFNSKFYPNSLKRIFSPPICIFVKGDIELLKKKKIYIYEEEKLSINYISIKNIICDKILDFDNSILINENFKVKAIDLKNSYNLNNNDNYLNGKIELMYNITGRKNSDITNAEILSGIIDLLIIPEARYTKNIALLVDSMIESGKEIVVFPNSIFNKNAYFSNYLIKNGANMITNLNELKEIIDKL